MGSIKSYLRGLVGGQRNQTPGRVYGRAAVSLPCEDEPTIGLPHALAQPAQERGYTGLHQDVIARNRNVGPQWRGTGSRVPL